MTAFETKDSGERQEYVSGMRRDVQSGKPRFDLLLVDGLPYGEQFLTRFAGLLERGAEKYGESNWTLADSAEELARFKASAFRHFIQWISGELDEDHGAAVAFNIMAADYVKWKIENESQVSKDSEVREPNSNSGNPCQCAHHKRLRQESPAIAEGFIR